MRLFPYFHYDKGMAVKPALSKWLFIAAVLYCSILLYQYGWSIGLISIVILILLPGGKKNGEA